jgi:predicted P-loop ATPase
VWRLDGDPTLSKQREVREQEQYLTDRWESATEAYAEIQAEITRQHQASRGGPTAPDLLNKAKLARLRIEELKRDIASLKSPPVMKLG